MLSILQGDQSVNFRGRRHADDMSVKAKMRPNAVENVRAHIGLINSTAFPR